MKASGFTITLTLAVLSVACAGRGTSASFPPAPKSVVEEEAVLASATGNIAGTMLLPAARFPVPVVLIIAGSGPTDRNGNSAALPGSNNSLKLLAEGLASRGIASLRYDKRGIAASRSAGQKESDLRFTTLVADASEWARKLDADPRFSTITVAGHSEGSLIGMLAAREAGADGYVSIAGMGRRASDIIRDQLSAQVSPAVLAQVDDIMGKIAKGEKPDSVPGFLNSLFRPSVQPYLTSWFAYDPAVEMAKLRIPVLLLQGSTDAQVKLDDANRLAAAKPDAKLVVVDGMNHVLKAARGTIVEQMPSYSDPALPVVTTVVDEIAALVKALPPKGSPRVKDSIGGIDKLKHFLVAGFVESLAFSGFQAAGTNRAASLTGAGVTTAVVSLGREVHGRRTTGLFSIGDLLWDAVGAGAAMLILARVNH